MTDIRISGNGVTVVTPTVQLKITEINVFVWRGKGKGSEKGKGEVDRQIDAEAVRLLTGLGRVGKSSRRGMTMEGLLNVAGGAGMGGMSRPPVQLIKPR